MTEPIELVDKDHPDRVLAYACPTCGVVVDRTYDSHADVERYRKYAARHCEFHCSNCDVLIDKTPQTGNYPGYGTRCTACDRQHSLDADKRRFDNAQHLTEEEWANDPKVSMVVYLDGEDHYFSEGLDELREWWCDHHYDPRHPDGIKQVLPDFPEYAWVCDETVGVKLDAQQILESAMDDYYEDAIDNVDVDALQALCDQWSAMPENQVRSWEPNFKKLVLLSDEINAEFLKKWREE